jgi:hypothetical protein
MLALTFLALLPRAAMGFLVIDILWRGPSKSRILQVFMAAPVGVGLSSLLSFVWIWAGLSLQSYVIGETAAVMIGSVLWARSRFAGTSQALRAPGALWPARNLGWWAALAAAAVIVLAQFWIGALQRPHGAWDAWAQWNVVSRFIYRGGQHWQGTFLRVYDHPAYPLLLGVSNAATWELVGIESARGPMALAFLYTGCVAGLLFGLVKELRGSSQACLAAIVLVALPPLVPTGVLQYADVPEACYFLASACMMLLYLRWEERSLAWLAGLMAGLAAWTKNEGLVFNVICLPIWAMITWKLGKPAIRDYLLGAAFPLLVVGLFKVFLAPARDVFSNPDAMMAGFLDASRWVEVLRGAASAFVSSGLVAPLLALAVYAALVGRAGQRPRGLTYVALLAGAQASCYVLAYVGIPFDYGNATLIPTSVSRLWMHVLPMLAMGLFLWLRSPEDLNLPGGRVGS